MSTTPSIRERHPTEVLIEQARALLKPSPVKLHSTPKWLVQRIRKACGRIPRGIYPIVPWAIEQINTTDYWLDHWGSTVHHGRPAFVSEPFLAVSQIPAAMEFAKWYGLELDIDANSSWYPGSTVRLAFMLPREDTTMTRPPPDPATLDSFNRTTGVVGDRTRGSQEKTMFRPQPVLRSAIPLVLARLG